jgi:hypothetical protein
VDDVGDPHRPLAPLAYPMRTTEAADEFAASGKSECAAGGRYGAIKQVSSN